MSCEGNLYRVEFKQRRTGIELPKVNAWASGRSAKSAWSKPFVAILDTGASGSCITQEVAALIGAVGTSSELASIADGTEVRNPLVNVDVILEISGRLVCLTNVKVAVTGANLIGVDLLPHLMMFMEQEGIA